MQRSEQKIQAKFFETSFTKEYSRMARYSQAVLSLNRLSSLNLDASVINYNPTLG